MNWTKEAYGWECGRFTIFQDEDTNEFFLHYFRYPNSLNPTHVSSSFDLEELKQVASTYAPKKKTRRG